MALIHSILMGAVAGARALTPLASLANAARKGELPADTGAPALLAHPLASIATSALAAGELAGDKLKTAPDRIAPPGLIARAASGAVAGASLVRKDQRLLGGALGAVAAVAAAYLTFDLRRRVSRRLGPDRAGAMEDMIALGGAALIVRRARAG